ncbi:uncharacterized protein LOC126371870 [Pectinophora gossypiella]|uniref:uncharacterized protein LOC126371870 n=1 Tax=Pectinophora gossypiella TaxID=13191 RepID=UPI00214E85FC|nr:uncharacterized protein LOC126371870 [Pectinophora gossypiella]
MTPKHLCVLLLAFVAATAVTGQSDDIPIENDNQFPPENPADVIEGSGGGTIDEPPVPSETTSATETTLAPLLEEVQPTNLLSEVVTTSEDQSCPKPCVCHYEGESDDFVVDCSGYDLTEFPSPIDPKTTVLNLQKNKLTTLPKEVSSLKILKVLNAENNSIMDLALGSVSELPELKVLKLANNRLIEYPQDLKNSLVLTKLEELDLGGNDMRTDLRAETLSNFQALRRVTLATSNAELLQNLCSTLKSSLETVCTESCDTKLFECADAPQVIDDDLIEATLPGMISFEGDENADPVINTDNVNTETSSATEDTPAGNNDNMAKSEQSTENPVSPNQNVSLTSGRALINNIAEESTPQKLNNIVEAPKDTTNVEVKAGAATTGESKTGGVDKSVIGIIVAGMVVVVAGITIKKNWSSIKNRFSSSPRPAERGGGTANGNGTSPEEVPLQDKDKSPV